MSKEKSIQEQSLKSQADTPVSASENKTLPSMQTFQQANNVIYMIGKILTVILIFATIVVFVLSLVIPQQQQKSVTPVGTQRVEE